MNIYKWFRPNKAPDNLELELQMKWWNSLPENMREMAMTEFCLGDDEWESNLSAPNVKFNQRGLSALMKHLRKFGLKIEEI